MTDQDDTGPPGATTAFAATHLRLCAHADDRGESMHWLVPGETSDRERALDLLDSPGFRQARACLDEADARETSGHEG